MLLALLALVWLFALFATDTLHLPVELLGGLALVGAVLAVLGWRGPQQLRLIGLVLLCGALGGLRYQAVQVDPNAQGIWRLAEQEDLIVQGVVSREPRRTDEGQQVILRTEAARLDERAGSIEGLLLVNLPPYPAYHYGQRVLVRGTVEQPRASTRPNAFNYREYLARKRIFALMETPDVLLLPGFHGNPLLGALLDLRNQCHALLLRGLPEPQSSVAAGTLLGLKATIPDEIYDAFGRVGASHLLVISGWHLSLVAALFMGLAGQLRLGRRGAFWFSLGAIWLYAMFVGATPTVLRAASMASLVVLATATERRAEPWTLLLAACWGLTLWDPQLLWDVGFQLSALATASLFAYSQPIKRWLQAALPAPGWLLDTLAATFAAQVLVLPLIIYHFGNLSLIAPLANVVLVPVLPFAMLAGALALVVNLLLLPLLLLPGVAGLAGGLVQGVWLLAWLPYAYLTEATRIIAALPWAALRLPALPLWALLAYYVLAVGGWLWRRHVLYHAS
jgi:competence protein ComEC